MRAHTRWMAVYCDKPTWYFKLWHRTCLTEHLGCIFFSIWETFGEPCMSVTGKQAMHTPMLWCTHYVRTLSLRTIYRACLPVFALSMSYLALFFFFFLYFFILYYTGGGVDAFKVIYHGLLSSSKVMLIDRLMVLS